MKAMSIIRGSVQSYVKGENFGKQHGIGLS